MIRYPISAAKLRKAIEKADANWYSDAAAALAELPAAPRSSDFKPLWSKIRTLYIHLQRSKCAFCEKPLEGNVEQDVEHFRPKVEVRAWNPPGRLVEEGLALRQPSDGASEPGYAQLAYAPFNYAISCKTCNSTLKKNFFPIEGTRDSAGADPARMNAEKALLIYPIGTTDTDPERLIEFEALSPVPKPERGFNRRRAFVTIELFRLDDSTKRRSLFKQRATLVRLLWLELEGRAGATTAAVRQQHERAIDVLTAPSTPFTNCLRSFAQLHGANWARAEQIATACVKLMYS